MAPIHLLEKRLELSRVGGRVPGAAGLRRLHQRLVLEKITALDGFVGQVFVQIGADAALGRVDLQAGENSQRLRLLPASRPIGDVGIFVVGDDAAIQRGVADLADAGGEGAADSLKPGFPVVGIAHLWLNGGDHQQGNVLHVGEGAVLFVEVDVVVAPDAGVQDRVGDDLYHVAVIVGTAQPFRRQHSGIYHDHVGEVAEVVVPHLTFLLLCVKEGELDLLVAGDMRIAQQCAGVAV